MDNLYPEAGKNAPPGVRLEIERFRALPPEERAKTPLLYHLLGDGTPAYKMTPEDSQYTDLSQYRGKQCATCQFPYMSMRSKKFICSQVSNRIKPTGWCRLWRLASEQ